MKTHAQKKMTLMTREPFKKIIRDEPAGHRTLEDAIAAIREGEACSGTEAMSKAARRHPDLLKKYNEEGLERYAEASKKPAVKARWAQPKQEFDLLVEGIAERERVPRHVAMGRARQRCPEKFREAYPER